MFRFLAFVALLLCLNACATNPQENAPAAPTPRTSVPSTPACTIELSTCRAVGCNNGWVEVRFDVERSGKVTNAVVTRACPPELFNDAALNAVRGWTFPPEEADHRGVSVIINFTKAQ